MDKFTVANGEDPMSNTQETFTITELAREFSVTARAIRFYEDKGLLSPTRNGQQRVYAPRDRARLNLILRGKRVGFSLTEIGEMLDLYNTQDRQEAQLSHSRAKFEKQVIDLEQQREDIIGALASLKDSIVFIDNRLEEIAQEKTDNPDVEVVGYGIGPASNAAE